VCSNSFSLVRYGPWRLCYWGGQGVKNWHVPNCIKMLEMVWK
jgi:hypothetical protein